MSDDYSVVARNLSKNYKVPTHSGKRLRGILPSRTRLVEAVKDVSFAVKKGEAVGVLGKNGSGKSTLLRMVAGVESPTTGEVLVYADPSLLGVSAALQPHLSGYENIRLGLLAMGFSRSEVSGMESEIIELSSLELEALDRPMNTYSSGMSARLTFAIATSRSPEILMVDEALGTGDATFAETAKKRMDELLSGTGTVFMVSHSASTLRKTCRRALWLHDGQIIMDGDLAEISPEYAKWGECITFRNFERAQEIIDYNLKNYVKPRYHFDSEIEQFLNSQR